MILADLIIPTAVARPGMKVEELFRECSAKSVPGIPFRDASGRITGKASIRNVLKETCIPDYLVTHSLDFAADGNLYATDYDGGLYQIDVATGSATPLTTYTNLDEVWSLATQLR